MNKIVSLIGLIGGLLLNSQQIKAEPLELTLFPDQPVYRTVMADPDIPKTEIKIPYQNLGKISGESVEDLSQYASLSKAAPLFTLDIPGKGITALIPKVIVNNNQKKQGLSDKILSLTGVASGQINFPRNQSGINYSLNAELFLDSPILDDYFSDGNKLFIVGGFNESGNINPENFIKENLQQMLNSFSPQLNRHGFSIDAYLVPHSPYSSQYVILRAGLGNMFNNNSESANIHLSSTWELPPVLYSVNSENFRVSPYLSSYFEAPLNNLTETAFMGQAGLEIIGKSNRKIIAYIEADTKKGKPWKISSGLKTDF